MELNLRQAVLLVLGILCGCAHQQQPSLDFYHIGKDIQDGIYFNNNTGDSDFYIPPQTKNIAILLSQSRARYRDIIRGFKIYSQQRDATDLRVWMLRGQHRVARLTRALHQRKVHGIITDLPRLQMRNFMTACNDYHVPILHLSSRRKDDSYLLRSIYPNFRLLVRKVVLEMQRRGFKRIAMLVSTHNHVVLRYFRRYAATAGLTVSAAQYQRDDFDSMSRVVQRLFAVEEETADAEEEGKTRVLYRQLQQFDAVFLPDDFKILQYFVKLFDYYTLTAIPIIGLHHWRSPQQTYSKTLQKDSFYVDFIGNYDSLPSGISSSAVPTSLASIRQIDQRLLGYRGMAWLLQAIEVTRHALRTNLNGKHEQVWQQRLARRFRRLKSKLWQPRVITVANRTTMQQGLDAR